MAAAHATSVKTYLLVFGALLALTATTVAVAQAPLGHWHTAAAVAIAITKASLVVLFFMHGLESGRLVWMVVGAALLWLAILLTFTFSDYASRGLDKSIRDPRLQGERGALAP
jgi:cytochrome c oxidase subunit 4